MIEINNYLHFHWTLVLLVIMLATLVSEDLTSIGVGLAARLQLISLPLAVFAALMGVFWGDILLYVFGRCLRRGFFLSLKKYVIKDKESQSTVSPIKKKRLVIAFFS